MRVNVGCGTSPTPGWKNFDNSLSLRLGRMPRLSSALAKLGVLQPEQTRFVTFAQANEIEYADAARHIPLRTDSVEVLYSSHMVEHLDRTEAKAFLAEALRVLRPGGVIRLAVPDLRRQAEQYLAARDADAFVQATFLTQPRPRSLTSRARLLLVGTRHHQWMYDGASLSQLLATEGFVDAAVLDAGRTTILNPEPLDLEERASESVYVEARKPIGLGSSR